jgi:hypothetical protein
MNTFTVLFPWLRPFASLIDSLHSPLSVRISPLFTYLEIPFLVIVVRMSIHSHAWLVINCSPLAS